MKTLFFLATASALTAHSSSALADSVQSSSLIPTWECAFFPADCWHDFAVSDANARFQLSIEADSSVRFNPLLAQCASDGEHPLTIEMRDLFPARKVPAGETWTSDWFTDPCTEFGSTVSLFQLHATSNASKRDESTVHFISESQ